MTAREELEVLIGEQEFDAEEESAVRLKGRSGRKPKMPGSSPSRFRPDGATNHNPWKRITMAEMRASETRPAMDKAQPWEGHPELLPKKPPGRKP